MMIDGNEVGEKSDKYAKLVADFLADLPPDLMPNNETETLAAALGALRAAARMWAIGAQGTPQLFTFAHLCHVALQEALDQLTEFDASEGTKPPCKCASCVKRRSMLS